jgi:c-di-GMP-binding flagellar brake protein YcgR
MSTEFSDDEKENLIFSEREAIPQFAVGLHLFFDINHKGQKFRAKANLLGWNRNNFLISSCPAHEKRSLFLTADSEIIVRYLLEGTVYGFTTRILRKYLDPQPFLMLKYPELVEVKSLRGSPRIQTLINVQTEKETSWILLDLSYNGALITLKGDARVGQRIKLTFNLPDGGEVKDLTAEVVRVVATKQDFQIAVKFDEGDEQLARVRTFVDSYQNISRRSITEFEIEQE